MKNKSSTIQVLVIRNEVSKRLTLLALSNTRYLKLFTMIGMVINDTPRPKELLRHQNAHHWMWQG